MSDISSKFLILFTDTSINPISKTEDFSEVKITYAFDIEKLPIEADYATITNVLNTRDTFHLSVLKDDDVVANFTNRNDGQFRDFTSTLNSDLVVEDSIEIVLTIEKNKIANTISIYYLNEFISYLNSLSFLTFLNVIERNLNREKLILEHQAVNNTNSVFRTSTILFTNKNSDKQIDSLENEIRENRIYNATSLCHWDIEKKFLLPEDFYPIINEQENQDLVDIFQKTCLLYSTMFVFDYLSIKDNTLSYKLNGYKTFGEEIITEKIEDINVEFKSVDLFYKIYQWIYLGGNTNDKISIARNIISLNYNHQTLELSKTSFDAILSNYKIYERQNVKQYIEVRNKLSEILIDLQGKIDKIVDVFIGDYKKNIITLLSFFISVIAIRVVSKGDFTGGFTTEIVILTYSFLMISIGMMVYSRWEFTKRISMFDKHYNQLKDRYKELLSEDELKKIFEDCNPQNGQSNSFVLQQKKLYTFLWIFSISILAIAVTVIHIRNNIKLPCYVQGIIQTILCCTKSI